MTGQRGLIDPEDGQAIFPTRAVDPTRGERLAVRRKIQEPPTEQLVLIDVQVEILAVLVDPPDNQLAAAAELYQWA